MVRHALKADRALIRREFNDITSSLYPTNWIFPVFDNDQSLNSKSRVTSPLPGAIVMLNSVLALYFAGIICCWGIMSQTASGPGGPCSLSHLAVGRQHSIRILNFPTGTPPCKSATYRPSVITAPELDKF